MTFQGCFQNFFHLPEGSLTAVGKAPRVWNHPSPPPPQCTGQGLCRLRTYPSYLLVLLHTQEALALQHWEGACGMAGGSCPLGRRDSLTDGSCFSSTKRSLCLGDEPGNSYSLSFQEPQGELEEMCTSILVALGSHCPGMVIVKLWDKLHLHRFPPRSLLVAVGKLLLCPGLDPVRGEFAQGEEGAAGVGCRVDSRSS